MKLELKWPSGGVKYVKEFWKVAVGSYVEGVNYEGKKKRKNVC